MWDEVKRLSSSTRRLKAIVDDLQLLSLAEATAVVKAGTLAALARAAQKEIEEVFTKATGRKIALTIQGAGEPARAPDGPPAGPSTVRADARPASASPGAPGPPEEPGPDARQHPLVKQAEQLLGARVVRVEARARPK